MSARTKQQLPHGTDKAELKSYFAVGPFQTVAEQRIAIAALFRAGFSLMRIAVIFETDPVQVEIELREYLLEARP